MSGTSACPSFFPRGGKEGIKYRRMLLEIVDLICAEYPNSVELIMDHVAHDLSHRDDIPWDGVSK